jgi:hypothetical protein
MRSSLAWPSRRRSGARSGPVGASVFPLVVDRGAGVQRGAVVVAEAAAARRQHVLGVQCTATRPALSWTEPWRGRRASEASMRRGEPLRRCRAGAAIVFSVLKIRDSCCNRNKTAYSLQKSQTEQHPHKYHSKNSSTAQAYESTHSITHRKHSPSTAQHSSGRPSKNASDRLLFAFKPKHVTDRPNGRPLASVNSRFRRRRTKRDGSLLLGLAPAFYKNGHDQFGTFDPAINGEIHSADPVSRSTRLSDTRIRWLDRP